METAEQAALSESEHDSAHHHHQTQSQVSHRLYDARHLNDYPLDEMRDVPTKPMRRFEKLIVNLTHSSVIVPAGISLKGILSTIYFLRFWNISQLLLINATNQIYRIEINIKNKRIYCTIDSNVQSSVAWSAHLDPIFTNNLERDAALSWQYFGSTTGYIRRFPGTPWPHSVSSEKKPIEDFRTQDWFIQAASSPKDIVSLVFYVECSSHH